MPDHNTGVGNATRVTQYEKHPNEPSLSELLKIRADLTMYHAEDPDYEAKLNAIESQIRRNQ